MNKHCYGCGVLLQDKEQLKQGYVNNLENDLCKRCFRMQNYNEYHSHYLDANYFTKLVKDVIKKHNLVILVVDLFDISSSLNEDIANLVKTNPVIIVGSKRDILLKSLKDNKLKQYLRKEAKKYELNIVDVLISSATKKYGIDELLNSIYDHYNQHNVYLLGITNVGKSSLVNALINAISKSNHQISISNYPGTTLDTIEIEIDDDNNRLCDLPGIVLSKQVIHYLKVEDYKYIQPKSEVKARIYQLNPSQSLFIGGIAAVNFIEGDHSPFTCYFSNNLNIHRTKLENVANLFDSHIDDNLLHPKTNLIKEYSDFKVVNLNMLGYANRIDIVILGLGWISIEATNQKIQLMIPKEIGYLIREAII